jgi:hypothetical protein
MPLPEQWAGSGFLPLDVLCEHDLQVLSSFEALTPRRLPETSIDRDWKERELAAEQCFLICLHSLKLLLVRHPA